MSNPISGLSFVFQEARHINESLSQLRPYVSEIIIVDQQSPDGTGEMAKKYADKVFTMPRLICGDGYREFLVRQASQPWLLWFYPDERFPVKTLEAFEKLTAPEQDRWDVVAFMRHEFMDEVELPFERFYPNYQTRLIRNLKEIIYPDLVHFELWGHDPAKVCQLPAEYQMEHHKTSIEQELDNWRLYVDYKNLIVKYGNTDVQPFKIYIDSYKKIVHDSEEKNLTGERLILMAEEIFWDWRNYENEARMTLEEFEKRVGVPYKAWVEQRRKLEGRE